MIKQTAQQIAATVAKQTVHESNEFLKSAREQISPLPKQESKEKPQEKKEDPNLKEEKFKAETTRLMQTYQGELNEIRRENLFKDLQRKISEGEEVPLENYAKELSFEQREVLKAQMEAVKMQKEAAEVRGKKDSLRQVVAKKGRNAMMGMFKKKNEQHVEMRQPPSG